MAGSSTGGRTAAEFEDEVGIRNRRTESEGVVPLELELPSGGPLPSWAPASTSTSSRHLSTGCGTGIAPPLPTIARAHAEGADRRLFHSRVRSLVALLDELATYGDRVTVQPQDQLGVLDPVRVLGEPDGDTLICCCGPTGLVEAVEKAAYDTMMISASRAGSRRLALGL
ncbi:hypothetical protein [Pseudonocardia alni]|uniref:hypothetical protein n=1 Tax=Pseudonocardia alni TaxID=33907 RepID=UPI00280A4FEF|nr:hypothetical protein [Pseudonocardia alni]